MLLDFINDKFQKENHAGIFFAHS